MPTRSHSAGSSLIAPKSNWIWVAAVNYHFGSKDALIQAVLSRRLDP
jgi:hypothetical protein